MHLAIDGYGGDTAKMWDGQLIRDFLFKCPDELGMIRITEPEVLEYNAPKTEDSGISGFVIIAESHISVHTFPRREYVNIDIFSCRAFDDQRALAAVKDLFGLEHARSWLLERGLEWLDGRQGLAQVQQQRAALESGGPEQPVG